MSSVSRPLSASGKRPLITRSGFSVFVTVILGCGAPDFHMRQVSKVREVAKAVLENSSHDEHAHLPSSSKASRYRSAMAACLLAPGPGSGCTSVDAHRVATSRDRGDHSNF